MEDHPLKTFISIFSGMVAGSVDLLNKTVAVKLSIYSLSFEATLALFISCSKAAAIGGSAWLGQTAAIYLRKKILKWWKEKFKK